MKLTETRQSDGVAKMVVLPPAQSPGLIDEVNHRIANSLQLLAAMVSIEARRLVDASALAALAMTQRRIGAIAAVHRQLYETREAAIVDLGAYLAELGSELERSCADASAGRHVLLDVDAVTVSSDQAMATGIIVSELIGNAYKYAYEPGRPGDVLVVLRAMPAGGYRLDVSDRGRGMIAGVAAQGSGLGAQLIGMMAARLNARHAWRDAAPGTHFTLHVGE